MSSLVDRFSPEWVRKRYLRKFAVALVVVLFVVGVASLTLFVLIQGTVEDNVEMQLETNADNEAQGVGAWIESNEERSRLLSNLGVLQDGSDTEIRAAMGEQLVALPGEVEGIHYIDMSDRTIKHSSDPSVTGTNVDDLDMEIHVGTGTGYREVAFADVDSFDEESTYTDAFRWDDEPRVAFLSPVEDDGSLAEESDGPDDLIMVAVDPTVQGSAFSELIEDSSTVVVDAEDGDIQLGETDDEIDTLYSEDGPEDSVIVDGAAEPTTTTRDGTVVAAAPAAGTDWVLVSHAPESNAFAVVSDVQNGLIAVFVVVLVGFAAVGIAVGRPTARAIESVADDAEQLSEGNLDVVIEESGRIDEVGQVEEAFRDTQEYLQTVALQAEALADGEFDAEALDRDVPGELGQSLSAMRTDLQQYVAEVEQSQQEAREAREEAEALAAELQEQATAFSETVAVAADGDLTQRLDTTVDNEAMKTIAESFNRMLAELEQTVLDLQSLASAVDSASIDVSSGAEEIDEASDGIAESAEEISAGTAEQTDRFASVQQEMGQLSATIEEVASTSDEVAAAAEEAAATTDTVATETAAIVEDMDDLEASTETITAEIEELGDEIERIETVVDVIDEIAEQTSILALNASIEAARAGDASASEGGDGFAVIADEVKALADETADSTDEIASLIEEVQASAEEVIGDAAEMRKQVQHSTNRVQTGLEAIDDVADAVDDVNDQVQTVSNATDEQAASAEEVVAMIDEATEISERTTDEAEGVAVAVEEQSASTSQVSDAADDLSETAKRLRDKLDAFATGEGEGTADADAAADLPATEGHSADGHVDETALVADEEPPSVDD